MQQITTTLGKVITIKTNGKDKIYYPWEVGSVPLYVTQITELLLAGIVLPHDISDRKDDVYYSKPYPISVSMHELATGSVEILDVKNPPKNLKELLQVDYD